MTGFRLVARLVAIPKLYEVGRGKRQLATY
jgi:hypothetical protein